MTNFEKTVEAAGKKVEDVTKIYRGKDHACRCGCRGHYYERGTEGFERIIKAMNKAVLAEEEIEVYDNFINVPFDIKNDKCFTIYFN